MDGGCVVLEAALNELLRVAVPQQQLIKCKRGRGSGASGSLTIAAGLPIIGEYRRVKS